MQFKKCIIWHVRRGVVINSHLTARMAQFGILCLRCGFSLGKLWFLLILKYRDTATIAAVSFCHCVLSVFQYLFSLLVNMATIFTVVIVKEKKNISMHISNQPL